MKNNGIINYNQMAISQSLSKNLEYIKKFFDDDQTIRYRHLESNKQKMLIIFPDGMTNSDVLNNQIRNILNNPNQTITESLFIAEYNKNQTFEDAIKNLLSGDSLLIIDGITTIYSLNTKGFSFRAIQEPDNEQNLYGPREGLIENIMVNISLVKRKLQTSDLKVKFHQIGTRTNTRIALLYLQSLIKPELLKEITKRINKIKIDGILESNYIDELTTKYPYTFFPTTGKTERPDKIVAKLLEGGLVIIVDGTPLALYFPHLFIENFHSSDDFYQNFYIASFNRILRYIAFFIAIFIAPIYIAFVGYHHDYIPTDLAISINAAITGVPMSVFVECISFMILFEMLRETGLRMSSKIGQALSIAGALIIGQAAVEAKIVSAPMVIVISISAVAGLMIPKLSNTVMIYRFIAVIFSSFLGLLGLTFVLIALIININSLDSFGYQYSAHFFSFKMQEFKDTFFRLPIKKMKKRPRNMAKDEDRMNENN